MSAENGCGQMDIFHPHKNKKRKTLMMICRVVDVCDLRMEYILVFHTPSLVYYYSSYELIWWTVTISLMNWTEEDTGVVWYDKKTEKEC